MSLHKSVYSPQSVLLFLSGRSVLHLQDNERLRGFILTLQSKDMTKGSSSSRDYTEFSKEKNCQCQISHLNSEVEFLRFQKGLSPGQGGAWFLPQISGWGQRHLEGVSDPRNLPEEGGEPSPLLHVAKPGCQRIQSSKH